MTLVAHSKFDLLLCTAGCEHAWSSQKVKKKVIKYQNQYIKNLGERSKFDILIERTRAKACLAVPAVL